MSVLVDPTETIDLLKSLIRIDSVNPDLVPGAAGESVIGRFLADHMSEAGLTVSVSEVSAGRPNVIGVLPGTGLGPGKSLMLNGHTDTVGTHDMDIDPFDPVERGGRIVGRGSADMKSGVAAMVSAACSVARSGGGLSADLIVAAVVDEEYASIGTESLVDDLFADAAIVTEPTDMCLTIAHKGFAWIEFNTCGKAAHGSDPASGRDAIMMMADLLQGIRQHEKAYLHRKDHPILGRPSVHASLIEGGKELSTYPDTCALKVERRTLPGETRESVQEEINQLVADCESRDPEFRGQGEVFFYRDPLEIDPETEIVKTLQDSAFAVMGRMPEHTGSAGWMDSGILSSAGIPTVIFGPTGTGFHGPVESVETESVTQCAQILANTILSFCGNGSQ